jgi:hypothetical protein
MFESATIFGTKFLVLVGITGFAAVIVYALETLTDKFRGNRRQRT